MTGMTWRQINEQINEIPECMLDQPAILETYDWEQLYEVRDFIGADDCSFVSMVIDNKRSEHKRNLCK